MGYDVEAFTRGVIQGDNRGVDHGSNGTSQFKIGVPFSCP